MGQGPGHGDMEEGGGGGLERSKGAAREIIQHNGVIQESGYCVLHIFKIIGLQ